MIYEYDKKNRYLFGEEGKKNLICVGVNPSVAEPGKLDPTSRAVKNRALSLGYDGWIIINIYPQRATKPTDLKREIDEDAHTINIRYVKSILGKSDIIWGAWGSSINRRKYLRECMVDVCSILVDKTWITLGPRSIDGHPHHPLYLSNDIDPDDFDIKTYIGENRGFF